MIKKNEWMKNDVEKTNKNEIKNEFGLRATWLEV